MANRFRWIIAGLLFFASMLNYLDRTALAIVAPLVKADLHINSAQLGLIFSIFFIGYASFNFVGGFMADRFGPKRVYGVAMAVWSVFCGLTSVAAGFWQLLLFRIIFGLGEGPMGSVTNKTVRNWFPRQEAGLTVGIAISGGNLFGAVITGPLVGFTALAIGWRGSFVAVMLLGLIWLIPWLWFATDRPDGNSRVSAYELRLIESGRAPVPTATKGSLGRHLASPTIIAISVAFFAANYIQYFLLFWMPSYLTSARGLDIKTMSIVTVIPWAVGMIGVIVGGVASDFILRRTGRPIFARKAIIVIALLLDALCLSAVLLVTTTTQAVSLMAFVMFVEAMIPICCWALLQDLVPSGHVGSVGGFVHFVSNTSGIVGPAITGYIVQSSGGYGSSFALAGAVALVGAGAVLFAVSDGAGPVTLQPCTPLGTTEDR
ncbi:MFS transporter [Acidisoma silvae]|uniref:MFS transporter n=1 Tax=Acidisoma silvae TaxID=2802396 RepID=A0A963YW95_9PROT|nr:MFS transporter [Acidisoma silvae]MCB8878035.1 MFS transporter [Acidisoma silvae]